MIKIDEDSIYYSMLECYKEFCDLSLMYGLPILTDKYNDGKKARNLISALQMVGKEKMKAQKRRAIDGIKTLTNENEIIIFIKGCYIELDIQLKRQLRRLLTDIEEQEVYDQLNKIVEQELNNILEIIKEKKNG